MHKLVDETLQFFQKNINEVLLLPIDMWCINDWLLKKLAEMMSVDAIEMMKDKTDKISSRLYL